MLTRRDLRMLEILTHRLRVISLDQIARVFWGDTSNSRENARRRLALLEGEGLVETGVLLTRSLPPLEVPIARWAPGSPRPDFGPIAHQLKSRWPRQLQSTSVVIATAVAGHRFGGGGGRKPRTSEASHDLGLASVYLRLVETDPARAGAWVSEATLYRRGGGRNEKLPDAMILRPEERTIIEFAGEYRKTKLEEFHIHCEDQGLAYELW